MSFTLVDDELERQLADPEVRKRWLVLDAHPDYPGHWLVDGFTNDYLYDLNDLLGSYRAVAPAGLKTFLEATTRSGYEVAFFRDPTPDLYLYVDRLNQAPEVIIDSPFTNTVNGMLPYQVQGYNRLKDLDYGVARWDTGTGKTVLASALVKHHQELEDFDLCFFVVKKNNKINTVRKLLKLAGVRSRLIKGTRAQRNKDWETYADGLESGLYGGVVVVNYEQFKDFVVRDEENKLSLTGLGERIFTDSNLMFIWDEMPVKLKTRTSELYKAICKCLYKTAPPQVNYVQQRPASMRSYMLSATPIENSPEDWFNCIRLMDGGRTYGTVTEFNQTYVKTWSFFDPNKPESFHNFERMRLKAASFIHQASKSDPDIAAVFPKAIEEQVYVDWDERNSAIYTEVQDLAKAAAEDEEAENVPIFSLIGTLQMLCDAPEMINDSAARREVFEQAQEDWEESPTGRPPRVDGSGFALRLPDKLKERLTNRDHPKLERLREILLERHPEDQVVIYTRFNKALMPYLETALQEWGVTYGRYTGTEKQQQAIQDAFQAGEIRVFLSSDSGSDSIDLDAGNVVIDYNLPWKWTTLTQRHNRVHRPTSNHDTVYYYTLLMEGSVEERVLQVIEKKHGYHNELFDPAAGDISASARLTKEDLMYILTGR